MHEAGSEFYIGVSPMSHRSQYLVIPPEAQRDPHDVRREQLRHNAGKHFNLIGAFFVRVLSKIHQHLTLRAIDVHVP